jgi:hypothetical protein
VSLRAPYILRINPGEAFGPMRMMAGAAVSAMNRPIFPAMRNPTEARIRHISAMSSSDCAAFRSLPLVRAPGVIWMLLAVWL